MKQKLILLIAGCLVSAGCQSSSLAPSRLSSSLFGAKEADQAVAQSSAGKGKSGSPNSVHSEYALGEKALQQGKLKEAKQHFLTVVQQESEHSGAHHRLGFIADKNKEYHVAELHYLAALRAQPRNADIACDLGYSYLLQERYDDSRRYLQKALTIDPNHRNTLLNLATLQGKQGDYAGSLALFRQAGNEEEAQANMARLFPQGPPAGAREMLANTAPGAPRENLPPAWEQQQKQPQQKIAQASQPRREPPPQPSYGFDPNGKREIPPDYMINDVFAQIDAETNSPRTQNLPQHAPQGQPQDYPGYPAQEQFAQAQPSAAYPAANGGSSPPPFPATPVHHQQQHSSQQQSSQQHSSQPQGSSLPGELPVAGNSQAYNPNLDMAAPGIESPYFQAPPVNTPAAQPMTNQPMANQPMASQPLPPGFSTAGMNPAVAQEFTLPPARNLQSGNGPAFSGGSSPSPAPEQYQEAVALALQMGMNAGPGQMFPVQTGPSGSTPVESSAGNNASPLNLPPVSGQGSPGATLPPFSLSPGTPSEQPTPMNAPTLQGPVAETGSVPGDILQVGNQEPAFAAETPSASSGVVQDWPYAPNAGNSQTTVQKPALNSAETPWFNQTTPAGNQPGGQNSLPQMSPQSGYNMPPQWPYSPQAQPSSQPTSNNGPVIHRGNPLMSAEQGVPAGTHSQSLPQIVPNTR